MPEEKELMLESIILFNRVIREGKWDMKGVTLILDDDLRFIFKHATSNIVTCNISEERRKATEINKIYKIEKQIIK